MHCHLIRIILIYRKPAENIYAVVGFLKLNNISEHGGATERCKRSICSNNSHHIFFLHPNYYLNIINS